MKVSAQGYLELSEEQARDLISTRPIEEQYEVEQEPFARGKYAAVRRCRHRASGQHYAAKYLRKWRRAADLRPEILHEVAILDACRRSPRVVRLFHVFESDHEMVLLLELAQGGELQMLLDRDIVPSESHVRRLMLQILLGLRDLHDINVAHLDIKPQNLVLTGEFPQCDVKLCDLGISRYIGDGADIRDMMGTPDYVAPEVLNYEPISLATDMWSVGVLIYVLLTGCSPFGGDTKQETFCNISQCNLDFPEDLFEDVSEEAIDLMRKLMVKEPTKRLTVQQSLSHPWFSTTSVPSPSGPSAQDTNSENPVKCSTPITSRDSARLERMERMSPIASRKFEKSSPGLSKKPDRPSPTLIRKPSKELPESTKGLERDPIPLKRTSALSVNIKESTTESASSTCSRTTVSSTTTATVTTTSTLSVKDGAPSKEKGLDVETNVAERSGCGMRSFRKTTFKKNMGSILERVTSCEDFENNNDTIHRSTPESSNKISTRVTTSKKVPAPETPAANSNASSASIPRLMNRAAAIQTMPLSTMRDFKYSFQSQTKTTSATSDSGEKDKTVTKATSTTTITSTTTPITSSCVPLIVTPSTTGSTVVHTTTDDKDCIYTFRKCYIVDDCENENGNSLVSDGSNESEASSGYYDNSSCCSSSDSVSDVSETSTDLSHDRLSTASMDSLDSCYGKERRHYSSTLTPFQMRNNFSKRNPGLKIDMATKVHQSQAFHLAVSTFNKMVENSNKTSPHEDMLVQEKIFASARRQAAKASHTTVINKVSRASFVTSTPTSTAVRKECALNITRESNSNKVVLQEVKAGKCSRFSEVKIESVQSRIKKFQS